jgi:hypothetical protein
MMRPRNGDETTTIPGNMAASVAFNIELYTNLEIFWFERQAENETDMSFQRKGTEAVRPPTVPEKKDTAMAVGWSSFREPPLLHCWHVVGAETARRD